MWTDVCVILRVYPPYGDRLFFFLLRRHTFVFFPMILPFLPIHTLTLPACYQLVAHPVGSGSRQGKDRPLRLNQERSRLRNQGMRSTASNESSDGMYPGRLITITPSQAGSHTTVVPGGVTLCSLVCFLDRSPPARICGHQGDDLLAHKRLRHHLLRARQARFQADQDSVVLMKKGDESHRAETRLASQAPQHLEAIHLGEIQAEEEQVGRALPAEKAQRRQRIIETRDLMALATEDDLEDLARGR